MVQIENIAAARWHPDPEATQMTLAFCTGTPRVYFWTQAEVHEEEDFVDIEDADAAPRGLSFWIDLPLDNSFPVTNLKWNADGSKLCVLGRDRFCICDVNLNTARSLTPSSVDGHEHD